MIYNGHEQLEKVSVIDNVDPENPVTLVEGKDYKLSYSGDTINVTDDGIVITVEGIGNYEGTFTRAYRINPRKLELTSESAEKPYDGTPLTKKVVDITEGELADTDKIEFNVTGSQTYVGTSPNEFTYEFSKKVTPPTKALNAIKDFFTAYGADGSVSLADNYDVSVVFGDLTVTDDTDDSNVITKTHENKRYTVGDTITFTIKATNIYDEPKTITIDEQAGVTITGESVFEDVQPGETVTTTATHKVTKADVKAGKFHNTATASFDGEDSTFNGDDEVKRLVPAGSNGGRPDTGDNGYGFDLTMMFGSAAAFLAMLFGRRRREQE